MVASSRHGGNRPSEPQRRAARRGGDANDISTNLAPAYGGDFWLVYVANSLPMVAVTLLFRYSDFVAVLGGSELQLGWIVGVGAVGSLAMRLLQGVGIDRFGARLIWLGSLAVIIASLLLHLSIQRVDSPTVYFVRMLYQTALAGAFGASITAISLRAPISRMAEVIGVLGTSGFVGMILGSQLGDLLCNATPLTRWHLDRMFLVAAGLVAASLVCATAATRSHARPVRRRRPPIFGLLARYHPGRLLLMSVVMGVGVGLPGTFLRPFAEHLGIQQIGVFFATYATTAIVVRMFTRRLPDEWGERPTILLGMAILAFSMLLYLLVGGVWTLVVPGFVAGAAHALLFPAVVAGAGRSFPQRYRGLATTMVLGMFDLGNLVGMPLAGSIIYFAQRFGLPPYVTLFVSFALLIVAASLYYWAEPRAAQTAPTGTIAPDVAVHLESGICSAGGVAATANGDVSHPIILDDTGQDCRMH